jgi:hypothetical protein
MPIITNMVTVRNFQVISDKFNVPVIRMCTDGKDVQNWIRNLYTVINL